MTRLHFIGVGGSGMSAVAQLWVCRGATVTGTDRRRTAYFEALEASGADVRVGHDASMVEGVDAVVISSAVRESNPELEAARAAGIEVWHRSEALVKVLEGRRLVAVAGSHGKTTTSAMVATALHGAGIDASFAVGARVFGIEGAVAGGYGGDSAIAVVEADESDGSFLRYQPEVAIVTNIEIDHLDHYGTEDALIAAFGEFAASAKVLVVCADDPRASALARELASHEGGPRVVTYGAQGPKRTGSPDVVVTDDLIVRDGVDYPLRVPVPGAHNRLNAAAAWIAAVEMGADPHKAAAALAGFAGTGRRFQLRGHARGITVIDDYAHHPTEVAALLTAARSTQEQRLVVLFQPALFSRTQLLAREFGQALSQPNAFVVLAPVHGDREDPIEGVSSQLIADAVTLKPEQALVLASSLEEAATVAADAAREGDLVLTVGSGTVTEAAQWILDALQARADAPGAGASGR